MLNSPFSSFFMSKEHVLNSLFSFFYKELAICVIEMEGVREGRLTLDKSWEWIWGGMVVE